jgi:uncharacterized surface protein with fasciclin (FAS1) repeats
MFKTIIQTIAVLSIVTFGFGVPVQAQATQNIVEIAQDTPTLSTLVDAVVAVDLVDTLSGTTEFTVFAPTNDAFAALGSTLDVLLLPENRDLLSDILTYHAVAGEVDAATALTLTSADSVQGDAITLEDQGGNLVLNGSVNVVQADVDATNGIVHVIDAVLLSDSLSTRVQEAVAASNDSADITVRSGGIATITYSVMGVTLIAFLVLAAMTLLEKQESN